MEDFLIGVCASALVAIPLAMHGAGPAICGIAGFCASFLCITFYKKWSER